METLEHVNAYYKALNRFKELDAIIDKQIEEFHIRPEESIHFNEMEIQLKVVQNNFKTVVDRVGYVLAKRFMPEG